MKTFTTPITLAHIAQILHCDISGDLLKTYSNVTELHDADQHSICFYENPKYLLDLKNTKAGLVILPKDIDITPAQDQLFIYSTQPYIDFFTLVTYWLQIDSQKAIHTISDKASIHPLAEIGANVGIAPFAVIHEKATIGENSRIGSHSVIGSNVKIGKNTTIYPHVTIYENCSIGDNCIVHAGAVIGADGFGFVLVGENQVKIPQVGTVSIEDDVEIGANSCIDRSTIGTTVVKRNTKIDNLVQIGHNCYVDEHSILCAQVGLAGNTYIGKTVYLAGQVGVSGHLSIEDHTVVGAQSGVAGSLTTGKYFGTPAGPAFEQKRIYIAQKELPAIVKYIKKLKKDA